jgi:formylglycine-generating enzyme required for sulfatase activity
MGANPSRNQADANPVDSVSWIEVEAFCQRLSWMFGKEVRLPTEEEFRKALGGFDPSDASGLIWSAIETKGLSQPVGQKEPFPGGYFDLLGNVSEWLASKRSTESNTAFHIGGHAQDSLEVITSVPVRELQKAGRNRLTGFRVVVLD